MRHIKIALIFLFAHILSANAREPFWRTSGDIIELAWRTYEHQPTGRLVTLMATSHWAPPEFYVDIESLIVGKHVIFEGIGSSLPNRKFMDALFTDLWQSYGVDYYRYFMAPHHRLGVVTKLGQVYQPELDFEDEELAHHADLDLFETEIGKIFAHGTDSQICGAITSRVINASAEFPSDISWPNVTAGSLWP